jgi:hypothetical protein
MKLKIALGTATALGLLMGAAYAGSGNTLYISQSGDRNIADVKQSLGSNSNIGEDGDPAVQSGADNRLTFTVTNWGTNNDNDIDNFKQDGNWNLFEAQAVGGSSGNRLNNFLQQGNGNSARIMWTQNNGGVVDSVSIKGDRNAVSIYQGNSIVAGSGNQVGTVAIMGSNNGYATGNQWAHGDSTAAVHIQQIGSGNNVASSTIVGSDNHAANIWAPGAFNKVHEIFQTGNNNGQIASIASTQGSNGNWIRINQNGNGNNFSVLQGINSASTQNRFQVTQDGNGNWAGGTQSGDGNWVNIDQDQNNNNATANISGDYNGGGTLAGAAGTLASANGLDSGLIKQNGLSNTATLTVANSSNNQFAFLQNGNNNTITGTVSGSGSNSATVIQAGNNNASTFSQAGSNNVTSISQ